MAITLFNIFFKPAQAGCLSRIRMEESDRHIFLLLGLYIFSTLFS